MIPGGFEPPTPGLGILSACNPGEGEMVLEFKDFKEMEQLDEASYPRWLKAISLVMISKLETVLN